MSSSSYFLLQQIQKNINITVEHNCSLIQSNITKTFYLAISLNVLVHNFLVHHWPSTMWRYW